MISNTILVQKSAYSGFNVEYIFSIRSRGHANIYKPLFGLSVGLLVHLSIQRVFCFVAPAKELDWSNTSLSVSPASPVTRIPRCRISFFDNNPAGTSIWSLGSDSTTANDRPQSKIYAKIWILTIFHGTLRQSISRLKTEVVLDRIKGDLVTYMQFSDLVVLWAHDCIFPFDDHSGKLKRKK